MKNKLILLTIPLVLLILCGVGALVIMDYTPSESMYLKHIEMAENTLTIMTMIRLLNTLKGDR